MLKEKIDDLNKQYKVLAEVHKVIKLVNPLRTEIKAACVKLKALLDSEEISMIDSDIKSALIIVYSTLEAASAGLDKDDIAELFNPMDC